MAAALCPPERFGASTRSPRELSPLLYQRDAKTVLVMVISPQQSQHGNPDIRITALLIYAYLPESALLRGIRKPVWPRAMRPGWQPVKPPGWPW